MSDASTAGQLAPSDRLAPDAAAASLDGSSAGPAAAASGDDATARNPRVDASAPATHDAALAQDCDGGICTLPRATALAAGSSHTCALLVDGRVACWGDNFEGQLGTGDTRASSRPTLVPGVSGATAIAAGGDHSCALISDGTVRCWGSSVVTLSLSAITSPQPIAGLTKVLAIGSGEQHTCVVIAGGGLRCWGDNCSGQLGDGTTQETLVPVSVPLMSVEGVAAGGFDTPFTCARGVGGVFCWGDGKFGQLGNGATASSPVPVRVQGLSGRALDVSVGLGHACARQVDNQVACWGFNANGQLGIGTTTNSSRAVPVPGLGDALSVSAAGDFSHGFTCALRAGGGVQCWGANDVGQLGNGLGVDSPQPIDVAGMGQAVAITAGGGHACAILASGGIRCWGYGGSGELGNGQTKEVNPLPVAVLGW
jgi:alpha-tubulin suppressor-like RCC1 family protein